MEHTIDAVNSQPSPTQRASPADRGPKSSATTPLVAHDQLDARSVICGLAGGVVFLGLAALCLALARLDPTLAVVWLPNAAAVALLLLARLRNEIPAYIAFAIASIGASVWDASTPSIAINFAIANLVEIGLVTWLIRRLCGHLPDLTRLAHLGRFLQAAGLFGPLVSALIAAPALGITAHAATVGALSWLLAHSLGMILVIPAALILWASFSEGKSLRRGKVSEFALLLIGGLASVFLIFLQDVDPLLFPVPPLTLLIAFRLGPLGCAVFLPGIALVVSVLTHYGFGPVAQSSTNPPIQAYLIQAFIAVNFTVGLPVSAIVAARLRLTMKLSETQREIALLTEQGSDAILKIDNNGVCTYASPSVLEVLGRHRDDLVGHSVTQRTHEDAHDRIVQVLGRLLTGVSLKERITYRRLLDSNEDMPVFIEADCSVVIDPETGQRAGIVVNARDVTERVELELLLTRARTKAEKAARAKSEFLANMSHEIRTPMNGVLGFAELMLQGDLDADNRRHTEMIVQSGRSMMMLLNDILDLSKIEAGEIAIDLQPVDLFSTIADCAAVHRPTAESKGLDLSFSAAGDEGVDGDCEPEDDRFQRPWIKTDGLRLRQIILNIVGNAVKFTENGRIEVKYWANEQEIVVEVSDTGIGISPSRIQSIFAPFTQAEGDTARRFGGTGLGLTISRQLAEILGGTIDVSSTPGLGSTFRLTLPADYTDPPMSSASESEVFDPADIPQSARILLVEDHDVNRMLATEMLERCGQKVAIAHDGNEALAMVIDASIRGRLYDLVLMDIQMPGCDGYAATRAIRAEGIGPDIMPIIALTANAMPEDRSASRNSGMQGHLAKPLVFAELAKVLQRWLPTTIVESDNADAPRNTAEDDAPSRHQSTSVSRHSATSQPSSPAPVPTPNQSAPSIPSQTHSPALLDRWNQRRSEAIEAVRDALQRGELGAEKPSEETFERLARLVHKLAGTAAIFGEADLGDLASAFERALRERYAAELTERIAFDLLSIADDPGDRIEASKS